MKTPPVDERLAQSIRQLPWLDELAKRSGARREQVQSVLAALSTLASEQLGSARSSFVLPGLCKARTRTIEPTPDRMGKNPFTGEVMKVCGRRGSHRIHLALDPALKALERR